MKAIPGLMACTSIFINAIAFGQSTDIRDELKLNFRRHLLDLEEYCQQIRSQFDAKNLDLAQAYYELAVSATKHSRVVGAALNRLVTRLQPPKPSPWRASLEPLFLTLTDFESFLERARGDLFPQQAGEGDASRPPSPGSSVPPYAGSPGSDSTFRKLDGEFYIERPRVGGHARLVDIITGDRLPVEMGKYRTFALKHKIRPQGFELKGLDEEELLLKDVLETIRTAGRESFVRDYAETFSPRESTFVERMIVSDATVDPATVGHYKEILDGAITAEFLKKKAEVAKTVHAAVTQDPEGAGRVIEGVITQPMSDPRSPQAIDLDLFKKLSPSDTRIYDRLRRIEDGIRDIRR